MKSIAVGAIAAAVLQVVWAAGFEFNAVAAAAAVVYLGTLE